MAVEETFGVKQSETCSTSWKTSCPQIYTAPGCADSKESFWEAHKESEPKTIESSTHWGEY